MKNTRMLFLILTVLIALLFVSCGTYSGYFHLDYESGERINFLPYEKEEKWGYANDMGDVIVEPKYDEVSSEYKNSFIAPVQIGGKWGFVDQEGNVITSLQFDEIESLSNGFIKVKKGGVYGFVDEKGKIVIEPQYTDAENFAEDGLTKVCVDGKYGFVDRKGKYVVKPMFDYIDFRYVNGIASYNIGDKFGYLKRNEKGIKIITDAVFDYSADFMEDYHVAHVEVDGKIGYIDENGKYVIKPIIDRIWEGGEFAEYYIDDKCGYLRFSNNGVEMITDAVFDYVKDFNEETGLAMVNLDGKLGWINKNGEFAVKASYTEAGDFSSVGLAAVKSGDKWGYINTKGKFVIEAQFIDALEFAPNGLAAVETDDGLWGYIDEDGYFVIEPKYDTAYSFEDEGRGGSYYQAKVAYYKNGEWKHIMIDENGEQTLYYWPS